MRQSLLGKILVGSLLISFASSMGFAEEAWLKGNLVGAKLSLREAKFDLSLNVASADQTLAKRILNSSSLEIFAVEQKEVLDKSASLKALTDKISENSEGEKEGRSRLLEEFGGLSAAVQYKISAWKLLFEEHAINSVSTISDIAVREMYTSVIPVEARTSTTFYQENRSQPRISFQYSSELGMRPVLSVVASHGLFPVSYIFQVDCSERLLSDVIAGIKVPFMKPEHILKCQLPDNRGTITFDISK